MNIGSLGTKSQYALTITLTIICLLAASLVTAVEPPTREELEQYKLDGSFTQRMTNVKALGNHIIAPRLLQRMHHNLTRKLQNSRLTDPSQIHTDSELPLIWQGMPTSGNVKILILLIAFNDTPNLDPADFITNKIFGTGVQEDYPLESLTLFYQRASFNKLNISGNVLGWYTTPYPRTHVEQNTNGRESLIKEALNHYRQQGHDFTQYDNDNDGVIDYFAVIWAGANTGWGNFWWGYQPTFNDSQYSLDGKRLYTYSWQWESRYYPEGNFKPDVLIHETGHALGLPDYYDYDENIGPPGGLGNLDTMDGRNGGHNCFSKFLLEWIDPIVINSGSQRLTMRSAAATGDALLIMPGASKYNKFNEFFMVENRYPELNDTSLPGSGLAIWHVDSRTDENFYDYLFDNSYTEHKLLRLMEADGLEQIEAGGDADPGDFYKEGDSFGPDTTPNSNKYDGSDSKVIISNISPTGETMTFNATSQMPLHITLQPLFKEIRAWLTINYIAEITINVELVEQVSINHYELIRINEDKSETSILTLPGSQFTAGSYHFIDKYIQKDKNYLYKITAYDTNNNIIGLSGDTALIHD